MHIKGQMNNGAVITSDTPAVEWDESKANKLYLRYETIDNDTEQYIELVDESTTAGKKLLTTKDTWNRRYVATYTPIN